MPRQPDSFKETLAAAVHAAKETGRLADHEARRHTAAEEASSRAESAARAREKTPPPTALHVNYACKRILMLGVNEDGSEKVLQDIDQSAGTHLTTRTTILLHHDGNVEKAKPMLEALAQWEAENASPDLVEAQRQEARAGRAWNIAYEAYCAACEAIMQVPVSDVSELKLKTDAYLRANADRLAAPRQYKRRYQGDMLRHLSEEDAQHALSVIIAEIAKLAADGRPAYAPAPELMAAE